MNRRNFFGLANRAEHLTNKATVNNGSNNLAPYLGEWTYEKAAHLLRRAIVGPVESEVQKSVALGMEKTIDLLFMPYQPSLEHIIEFAGKDPETRWHQEGPDYEEWTWNIRGRRMRLAQWQAQNMLLSTY